ncbi:hypothetical protein DVH05_017356 [Phytophthora capsici]|nr:hypothetical protein DVH05_017356 [Phytophthora capsici]
MASVFVRNLPFGVTQEELEQVFSEVGPVKKIDVIKDKGKRKSEMLTRGFAFVKLCVSFSNYCTNKFCIVCTNMLLMLLQCRRE